MEGDGTVVDTTAVSVVAVAGGISAIEEAAAWGPVLNEGAKGKERGWRQRMHALLVGALWLPHAHTHGFCAKENNNSEDNYIIVQITHR